MKQWLKDNSFFLVVATVFVVGWVGFFRVVEPRLKHAAQDREVVDKMSNDLRDRFVWSDDICPRSIRAYCMKDKLTGKSYLIVGDGGVIEITEPQVAESTK